MLDQGGLALQRMNINSSLHLSFKLFHSHSSFPWCLLIFMPVLAWEKYRLIVLADIDTNQLQYSSPGMSLVPPAGEPFGGMLFLSEPVAGRSWGLRLVPAIRVELLTADHWPLTADHTHPPPASFWSISAAVVRAVAACCSCPGGTPRRSRLPSSSCWCVFQLPLPSLAGPDPCLRRVARQPLIVFSLSLRFVLLPVQAQLHQTPDPYIGTC